MIWLWKSLSIQLCALTNWVHKAPTTLKLVLLTGQIHHLTAFNCDLLTSCWLVFSSQWPIAISLVITLPKSSREPDNARELYMSPVSSAAKNRTPQLNEISACLQWGATMGSQGRVGVCVSIPTGDCGCRGFWYVHVWRLCGLRVCDGCYNLDREGCDGDTAHTFRHVCVSPEEERGFLLVTQKQTRYVRNEQRSDQMHNRRCVVCR